MHTGKITKLVPLTSQSEVERAQLVRGHNELGYGYLRGADEVDIYFHHDAIDDCSFDELWVGQEVEYELDSGDERRAQKVELLHKDAAPGRSGVRMPPAEGYAATVELPGSPAKGTQSARDVSADTNPDHDRQQLLLALNQLEQQLESPVIPGELPSWLTELHGPIEEIKRILPAVVRGEHRLTLAEIAQEDPELQRRVEQLRAEDQQILDKYGSFLQMYGRLRPAIEHAEPDESKAEALLEEFVARGLQAVIAMRKQEHALRTWLLEALERDRGDVD